MGRSLPQNGPDPRWYLQEQFTSLSQIPRCISFVIRKCSQNSNEVVGKVILSHPDELEWLQNMTSKPVVNYQDRALNNFCSIITQGVVYRPIYWSVYMGQIFRSLQDVILVEFDFITPITPKFRRGNDFYNTNHWKFHEIRPLLKDQ